MHRYLLVRHAQPEAGVASRSMSGQVNPPLTDGGRVQAAALGERLAGTGFDAAWSSDLRRAAETAEVLMEGRNGPALRLSPLLRELDFPPAVDEPDYAEREREALAGFSRDLREWLGLVEAELSSPGFGPDQTILVVAHAGLIRVLLCILLELPVERHWAFKVDWASLSVVERGDDMGTLALFNDRCHLGG